MQADDETIPQNNHSSKSGTAKHRKTYCIDTMREFLRYEPETGNLYWLPRDSKWFTADSHCKGWNTRYAGKVAACVDPKGYIHVSFYGQPYMAHRVIWAMVHGEWPDEIDHIDGDPSNNRLANLRDVTRQENLRNQRTYKTARSGFGAIKHFPKKGITPERWRVVFRRSGGMPAITETLYSLEEAIAFRDQKYREAGFHENHARNDYLKRQSA